MVRALVSEIILQLSLSLYCNCATSENPIKAVFTKEANSSTLRPAIDSLPSEKS